MSILSDFEDLDFSVDEVDDDEAEMESPGEEVTEEEDKEDEEEREADYDSHSDDAIKLYLKEIQKTTLAHRRGRKGVGQAHLPGGFGCQGPDD